MRGSEWGVTSKEAIQLTSATATWLIANSDKTTSRPSSKPFAPSAYACVTSVAVNARVISAIAPR